MSETSPAKYGVILGIWDTHFQCHASKTGKKGKSAHKDQRLDQWYGVVEESQGCYIIKREGNCGIRKPILNFTHFCKVGGFGGVRRGGRGRNWYQGGQTLSGYDISKGWSNQVILTPFFECCKYFFLHTPSSDAPGEPLYNWIWLFCFYFHIYSTSSTTYQKLSKCYFS